MNAKNELFTAKLQTTFGTKEVPTIEDNYMEVLEGSKLDIVNETEDNVTTCSGFGQNAPIVGPMRADVQLDFAMRSFGVGIVPDWMKVAQASGFSLESNIAGYYKLTPTLVSEQFTKDITVYHSRRGNTTTGILKKAYNCVFDWSISGEINKATKISFIGKGSVDEVPSSITLSTCGTKIGTVTPALIPISKSIIGSAVYVPLSFEIKGNQPVEQRIGGVNGYDVSELGDRKIDFSCRVYAEAPSVVDPYTALRNSTTGAFSFVWGPAGERIKINSNNAVISDVKETTSGNLVIFDITGKFVDNNFYISVRES